MKPNSLKHKIEYFLAETKHKSLFIEVQIRKILKLISIVYESKINFIREFDEKKFYEKKAQKHHPQTFSKYKNIYNNKSVAVVGCGPTAAFYNQIDDVIHVGINRAFKLKTVKLNYLFALDWMEEEDMLEADNYLVGFCKKFFGTSPHSGILHFYPKIRRIPKYHRKLAKSQNYYIYNHKKEGFSKDIENEPLCDIGGTIFSALQFILHTNPKKLYIVGCDCSTGHFHKEQSRIVLTNLACQIKGWLKFKEFTKNYYPDLEIISINPVGLKGVFKDVYTQNYIETHPELKKENFEIIDKGN